MPRKQREQTPVEIELNKLRGDVALLGAKLDTVTEILEAVRKQTETMGFNPLPLHKTLEEVPEATAGLKWVDLDGNPVPHPLADAIDQKTDHCGRHIQEPPDRTGLSNAEVL